MIDMSALLRTLDQLTDTERQHVMRYLERQQQAATPAPETLKTRIAGLHEHLGGFWMSDDFNDELSDEFWFGEDDATSGNDHS